MMRKLLALTLAFILTALPFEARALLMPVSDTLVFDSATSQYWYRDISFFNGGTGGVDKALAWVQSDYYGLTNWHLGSRDECNTLLGGISLAELLQYFPPTNAGVFYPGQSNLGAGNYKYWAGGIDRYFIMPGVGPFALSLFAVRVDYAATDLAQVVPLDLSIVAGDGPQWLGLSEVGAWVTAQGPPPGSSGPAPVPEPTSILLLCAGLAGLAGMRTLKKPKATAP